MTPAEIVAAINRRIAALRARDTALIRRIVALETSGASAPAWQRLMPPVEEIARAILSGGWTPPTPDSAGAELAAARAERAGLAIAIERLDNEHGRASIVAMAERVQALDGEWRKISRRRAEALMELRAANAEAFRFKARHKLSTAGIMRPDPAISTPPQVSLLGLPHNAGPGYEFLKACLINGIISQVEFEDYRNAT
ncbi:MAG: hypothetical protein AB7S71_01435 [Dongiaceae bacterium]